MRKVWLSMLAGSVALLGATTVQPLAQVDKPQVDIDESSLGWYGGEWTTCYVYLPPGFAGDRDRDGNMDVQITSATLAGRIQFARADVRGSTLVILFPRRAVRNECVAGDNELSMHVVLADKRQIRGSDTVHVVKRLFYVPGGDSSAFVGVPGLQDLLAKASLEVTSEEDELDSFDAVIISGLRYPALQQQAGLEQDIIEFVQGGGRLIVVGGPASYGAGQYQDSELATLLPATITSEADAQELTSAAAASFKRDSIFYPLLNAEQGLEGFPGVLGYNQAGIPPSATTVASLANGAPLLLTGMVGQGLAFAYTSGLTGPWVPNVAWEKGAQFRVNLLNALVSTPQHNLE